MKPLKRRRKLLINYFQRLRMEAVDKFRYDACKVKCISFFILRSAIHQPDPVGQNQRQILLSNDCKRLVLVAMWPTELIVSAANPTHGSPP